MDINMKLAQEGILNVNGVNHVKIDIIPPEVKGEKSTKPSLVIFVIDKSGSMDEGVYNSSYNGEYINYGLFGNTICNRPTIEMPRTKMAHAIESTIKVMNLLTPDDLFGVISFNDYADITQELIHITEENKNRVAQNVRSIYPTNCTNISMALQKAMNMITPEYREKYNCKIVLLSDGYANQGLTNADSFSSLSLKFLQQGVMVSSLGVGCDYSSSIMNAIATSGGGLFYHVEDIDKLSELFKKELKYTSTITAKDVKLFYEIPE